MAVIRVTPEELDGRAQMLEECVRHLQQNIQAVRWITSNLQQEWESPDSDQFQDRIHSLMPHLDQMVRVLEEYSGSLRCVAAEYASNEQTAADATLRALFN